jgi:hypothetical protein
VTSWQTVLLQQLQRWFFPVTVKISTALRLSSVKRLEINIVRMLLVLFVS